MARTKIVIQIVKSKIPNLFKKQNRCQMKMTKMSKLKLNWLEENSQDKMLSINLPLSLKNSRKQVLKFQLMSLNKNQPKKINKLNQIQQQKNKKKLSLRATCGTWFVYIPPPSSLA